MAYMTNEILSHYAFLCVV